MKPWLAAALLATAAARADGRYGTSLESTPWVTETQRAGNGPLADSPSLQFNVYVISAAPPTAVLFYVGAVHAPGEVALNLVLEDGGTELGSSISVVPGWNEWALPPTFNGMGRIALVPDAGVEFSLLHLAGSYYSTNPQTGYVDFSGAPISRVGIAHPHDDVSAVFRLPGETDRWANSSGCPVGSRDGLRGFPYVRTSEVPIGSGQTQLLVQQSFAHLGPTAFRFIHSWTGIDGYPTSSNVGSPTATPVFADGGLGRSELAPNGEVIFTLDRLEALPVGDGGTSEAIGIRLSHDGGSVWRLFDVGPDALDPCHPAVRATYGGHAGRALNQPAGADFALRYQVAFLQFRYPDVDRDGFKGSGRWDAWAFGDGLDSDAGDDCDDRDAGTHPGAPERCDGLDTDCSGVADDADRLTAIPKCEKQLGVCANSSRLGTDCFGGVWASCPAARYGADFSSLERCDGLDNNCNGGVDEPTDAPLCSEQRGVCAGARSPMCGTSAWAPCGPSEYGTDHEATESRCDGLDNDCDGLTDADDPDLARVTLCPLQQGVCNATEHTTACGTSLTACAYGPLYEADESTCDHRDNDCDGQIDEGCPTDPTPRSPTGCGCTSLSTPWLALIVLLGLRKRRSRDA